MGNVKINVPLVKVEGGSGGNGGNGSGELTKGTNTYYFNRSLYARWLQEPEQVTLLPTRLPQGNSSIGSAAVGENIYLFGFGSKPYSILRYNTISGSIDTMNSTVPLPTYIAEAVGNLIYLFPQTGASTRQTVYIYNVFNDSLTASKVTNYPIARYAQKCARIGDSIFIFGGITETTSSEKYHNDIYRYDISTDTLSSLALNLPQARARYGLASDNSGNAYIIGGWRDASNIVSTNYLFNSNNTVTSKPQLPVYNFGSACVYYNGSVYIFGGATSTTTYSNTIYKFNQDEYLRMNSVLPERIVNMSPQLAGDTIYLFGGMQRITNTATQSLDTIYAYTLSIPDDMDKSHLLTLPRGSKVWSSQPAIASGIPLGSYNTPTVLTVDTAFTVGDLRTMLSDELFITVEVD